MIDQLTFYVFHSIVYIHDTVGANRMDQTNQDMRSTACYCLNVRRASNAITATYDKFLAPSGLKISQYSLLRHIKYLNPVSVTDLAINLKLDRTTLVRNLRPLEEKGLIADVSHKGSRNRQLMLTETGVDTLIKADLHWQEAQDYMERYLGSETLFSLIEVLSKVGVLHP